MAPSACSRTWCMRCEARTPTTATSLPTLGPRASRCLCTTVSACGVLSEDLTRSLRVATRARHGEAGRADAGAVRCARGRVAVAAATRDERDHAALEQGLRGGALTAHLPVAACRRHPHEPRMQELHDLKEEYLRGLAPEAIAELVQQLLQRLRRQDSEIKFKDAKICWRRPETEPVL